MTVIATALRFRSLKQGKKKNSDNNNILIGSPSNRSSSLANEWSDPREADDFDDVALWIKGQILQTKTTAAASSSASTAAQTTTHKPRTPSSLSLSASATAAATVVTPDDDDDNKQRQTSPAAVETTPTKSSTSNTTTSSSSIIVGKRQNDDDDEDQQAKTVLFSDDDNNNDKDCNNNTCAGGGGGGHCFQFPCHFLLPFLRQLDLIPFVVQDSAHHHHDSDVYSSDQSPLLLQQPSNQNTTTTAMRSSINTTTTDGVAMSTTYNVNKNHPEHPKTGKTMNGVKNTFDGSASSLEQQHDYTNTFSSHVKGGQQPQLQHQQQIQAALLDCSVLQQQQQLQPQHYHNQIPISLRTDVIYNVDKLLEKQPTCHDNDDDDVDNDNNGGVYYNDDVLQQQEQPTAPTPTNHTAITSPTFTNNDDTITDTNNNNNKNNKQRRFLFAKGPSKKSSSNCDASCSVISGSRSLQSSNTMNHRNKKKKNRFKTLFSNNNKKNINNKQLPPLQVVSTTSPCCDNNNNNIDPINEDDVHDSSFYLSFSPLDTGITNDYDDDSLQPPCTQEKQHARRNKKHGRLSFSSSVFRSTSFSSKNKKSASSLSFPQIDEPEQNPRLDRLEQPQLQQYGSSGTTTTTTASSIMTPSLMTSSPLSLEPRLLSHESTLDTPNAVDEAVTINNSNTICPDRSTSSSSRITSMEWLLSRQSRLDQEMHQLFELEKASLRIQQRAIETTSRISQLTQTTMKLQEALQQSLSSLQQETSCLQQVEAEQARIEQATVQVAQQVQDSIVQGLRQMSSTSNAATRMASLEAAPRVTASTMSSSNGRPQISRAAAGVNMSTSNASFDVSPFMQQWQQQQQPLFPRRRAATEDVSTSTAHRHCETFQRHELQLDELLRTPPPEQARMTQLSPPRRRANTDPIRPRSSSSVVTFMRVSDLDLDVEDMSSSSLSLSFHATSRIGDRNDITASTCGNEQVLGTIVADNQGIQRLSNQEFLSLEENITLVLDKLAKLGLEVATDESERFTPTRETQWLLQGKKYSNNANSSQHQEQEWPFSPWRAARDMDILVWTGRVPHKGFGHDWPVVKARGIVEATPRRLLDFLLDSKEIKRYNKMSQGRDDVYVFQAGVDTKAEESLYGFAGDVRIFRSRNKPKILPVTMEMVSLWYSQPLEQQPSSYMIVSRSVWENEMGTTHSSSSPSLTSLSDKNCNDNNMLRCEMLLGVHLLRPVTVPSNKSPSIMMKACELTTITHVFSSGVPELMAKRAAPSSAANLIREIQALFP